MYGAAVLAAVGTGWFVTAEAATGALVRAMPAAEPGPDAPAYAAAHARCRDLYPALAPTLHPTEDRGRIERNPGLPSSR